MTRWYRAYAGTVSDAKLGEAALVAECSRSVAIAIWHALLEDAAETNDGGRFETTARRIAAMLGEPLKTVDAVLAAFDEIGLKEGNVVAAWKKRQYESDNSTERSRQHRQRKRDGGATLQQQQATPPETETETETETEKKAPSLRSGGARATRLPDDWAPVDDDLTFAAQHLALDRIGPTFDKFRDYWAAKAGAGGLKRDWSATWRNWVRREVEHDSKRQQGRTDAISRQRDSRANRRSGILDAVLDVARGEFSDGRGMASGFEPQGLQSGRGEILDIEPSGRA